MVWTIVNIFPQNEKKDGVNDASKKPNVPIYLYWIEKSEEWNREEYDHRYN